ncbi:MAG: DUF1588 domain-containing protein [Myxococcales bacterium]|nr:DUF1588 domain-containing protein [Myxococcales bacterium]
MAIKRTLFHLAGRGIAALLAVACSADGTSSIAVDGPDGASDATTTQDDATPAPDATEADTIAIDVPDVNTPDEPDTSEPPPCVPTESFFVQNIWAPVMSTTCIACHSSSGAAKASRMVLRSESWPGWLDFNLGVLREISNYDYGGLPLLLAKPSAQAPHGGGEIVPVGTPLYADLEELVTRLKDPVTCQPPPVDDAGYFSGVVVSNAADTFRKAALNLAGRLPTVSERTSLEVNGDAALDAALDVLLDEPAFLERLMEAWNDLLLTNRYDKNQDALNLLNEGDFPARKWFEKPEYPADASAKNLGKLHANRAVAQAPLELISWVVRQNRPFSEVLTADYVVVNPFSARVFGVTDQVQWMNPLDPEERAEAKVPGIPHAGVLTDPMFLNRFPTTETNRNRQRSKMVWRLFLGTDVLALAEQPIDPTTIEDHNPTLFNPSCSICHEIVDPVAGAFSGWTAMGRFQPPEGGWHGDMRPPGFEGDVVPADQSQAGLQWLASHIAADPRFPTAIVKMVWRMLTGVEPLKPPSELDDSITSDDEFAARKAAWDEQETFLQDVAAKLVAGNLDIKVAFKAVITSKWYRAVDVETYPDALRTVALGSLGRGRLLTPELLSRKVAATTGYPWRSTPTAVDTLLDGGQYRLFYGGIDSDQVTQRITDPSGMMAAVQERMANEVACRAVSQDFARPAWERRLFPQVERGYQPVDANGFEVPKAIEAIRENIRTLHQRLLGETLPPGHEELEATWQLWHDTWEAGRADVAAGTQSASLSSTCAATKDWWTGATVPAEWAVSKDDAYTVRAWTAVVAYLLTDPRFLYE